jgi:hypothetical protein|tara:strand:+ start:5255 stop:5461 length:207 start_codon:yes stop_codon:yes gene_type:complete
MSYKPEGKSVKGLTPIEAGFVKFFERMETAFKNVNNNYKNIEIQNPKPVQKNPRTPDRDAPNPFQGGF